MKKLTFIFLGCIFAIFYNVNSFAQTTMSQEGQYIFNSLGFYIGGVLVAFIIWNTISDTTNTNTTTEIVPMN